MHYRPPLRDALVGASVVFASATVLIVEFLSLFQRLDRPGLAAAWAVTLAAALPLLRRFRLRLEWSRPPLFDCLCIAAVAAGAAVIARVALASPPNSVDALSYHLPRVLFWAQNRSVAFFPTSYLNQVMMPPVAEYLMLHTYLLSGGDRFSNLVQFGGYVGSIAAVSAVAGRLGLDRRGQVLTAVFCATLPNAILQASGAKNDLVLALWLAAMALFALRWLDSRSRADLAILGLAAGLALGTKGTAYLFAPPMLLAVLLARGGLEARGLRSGAVALAAGVLLLNLPQFLRNYDLSGSIMGFDSAQGDGLFRWRNERLGWKPAVSNILRNASEQLGTRSDAWNRGVYGLVLRAHHALGIDPESPETTWRWAAFEPPRNANHEANANNRWHLLVLAAAVCAARRRWLLYALGPLGGFLAFCFYLKWQPYFSRLELPLFVMAAPLAGMALARLGRTPLHAAVCLVLLSNSRLAVTQNWTRPLAGPRSVLTTPRHLSYFNDMAQWNNRGSYLAAVDRTSATGCATVGIDITHNHVEYPFQALLREKNPAVRFLHTGVSNASAKYAPPGAPRPCAVLCLDCAEVASKVALYRAIGEPLVMGRFLLFVAKPPV